MLVASKKIRYTNINISVNKINQPNKNISENVLCVICHGKWCFCGRIKPFQMVIQGFIKFFVC